MSSISEKMRTALFCLTSLLFTTTFCQANSKVPCRCTKTSNTVLHVSRIKNYRVQKAHPCLIDAVEFLTVRGITVCSDPKKPWVQKAMAAVDARRKMISSTAVPTSTAFRPKWNTTDYMGHTSKGSSSEYREILEANDVIFHEPKTSCCEVTAFVSTTIGDMKIHSDPQNPWVKKGITSVDISRSINSINSKEIPPTAALKSTRTVTGPDYLEDTVHAEETSTGSMKSQPTVTFCV